MQRTPYGARFVGPTLVGPFLADTLSATLIGRAYLVLAALYTAAIWHTFRIDRAAGVPASVRPPVARLGGQFVTGLRSMLGSSAALVLLLVVTAHCALTMSYDALLPQIAQQMLHGNGATYSSLSAATGIGAIAGTLTIASLHPGKGRVGALLVTALGSGLAPTLLAVAPTPLVASLAAGAMGGTQAAFMVLLLAVLDLVPLVGSTHRTARCHPSKSGKVRCARQTSVIPSWQQPAASVSAARDQPADAPPGGDCLMECCQA